jgi:glucokinase
MILCGDIGGTKVELALYDRAEGRLIERRAQRVRTDDGPNLESLVHSFLDGDEGSVQSAAFGIAGPVVDERVVGANLPWEVDARALAERTGIARVTVVNDLAATAVGLTVLEPAELQVVHPGRARPGGPIAVVAAGTGLGVACLAFADGHPAAIASEGGHADYAPRTDLDVELFLWLRARFGEHVSWERVVSGPGLGHLYEFLKETGKEDEPAWLAEARQDGDPSAAIAEADGKAAIATRALDLFVEHYGAVAGNVALTFGATGGVALAGGIAPKLAARLSDGRFVDAFLDKGRLRPFVESIPVSIILNERTGLLGAALIALARA